MDMYKLAFAIRDAQAEQKKRGGKKGETEYRFRRSDGALTSCLESEPNLRGSPLLRRLTFSS
jgi:hypothetical protein